MKRLSFLLLFAALFTNVAFAQGNRMKETGNDRFAIKAQPFMGFYIDMNRNLININPSAPTGINLGLEFPSSRQRYWQQYHNDPTVGFGLSYINWGADKPMGHAISAYPYILLHAARAKHFELKFKLAAGLGVVSRHYYSHEINESDFNSPINNTTFSTYLNVYLSAGLDMDFPITRNFAINTEFGFFHMSNGKIRVPNRGANVFYGAVGMIATINPEEEKEPMVFPNLPYRWSLNVTGAAGAMHLDREDKHKFFIASLHTGAIYNVCNWYGVGAGVDVFFNDCVSTNSKNGFYREDLTYTFTDKLRVGIGINNEFTFGDVTAILDWGVYVFNPSRNYYNSYYHSEEYKKYGDKRPLFYKCKDVGVDDGWNYFRFGAKYRIWDNIYVQASAKMHLQICEYVEFGIGYRIPFLKKSKRQNGKVLFHHNRKWWEKY